LKRTVAESGVGALKYASSRLRRTKMADLRKMHVVHTCSFVSSIDGQVRKVKRCSLVHHSYGQPTVFQLRPM